MLAAPCAPIGIKLSSCRQLRIHHGERKSTTKIKKRRDWDFCLDLSEIKSTSVTNGSQNTTIERVTIIRAMSALRTTIFIIGRRASSRLNATNKKIVVKSIANGSVKKSIAYVRVFWSKKARRSVMVAAK